MTLSTLLALLLMLPLATDGPDDKDKKDGDDKKEHTIERTTSLRPLTFTPATGYTVKNLVGATGRVWATGAYGYTERYYNDDSDEQDLGVFSTPLGEVDAEGRLTSYIVHVGGAYDISRIGDMNISVGADLGLAQREIEFDVPDDTPGPVASALPDGQRSSGFAPQNLTLFGEIARPTYTLRAGYMLDLGPEAEEADEFENTDRQDAVLLGLSAQYPATNAVRVFGGFDYFITLEGESDTEGETIPFDEGDLAALHAGAGYNFGQGEIGVTFLYRINTEGEDGDTEGNENQANGLPNQLGSGNSLGVVPYVNYTPLGANFQVTLKGAVQTEYFDYGYTFAGQNDIAPRFGFTLGVQYGI